MLAPGNVLQRCSCVAATLFTLLVSITLPAAASEAPESDARWEPWLGCWTPVGQAGGGSDATPRQVCVVPAEGTSAVDIVTIRGAQVVSREHIDASGIRRSDARDGCTGWERARWSTDGRRVYLQSEYECTGGVRRNTTGVMAATAGGDWIDIVGVAMQIGRAHV